MSVPREATTNDALSFFGTRPLTFCGVLWEVEWPEHESGESDN